MKIGHKITIQCVASTEGCKKCIFSNDMDLFKPSDKNCCIKCMDYECEDNTSVIFVEVKEYWVFMWQDSTIKAPGIDNPMEVKGIYLSEELAYSRAEQYVKSNSGHWYIKYIKMDM